jgi:hypothetical protein
LLTRAAPWFGFLLFIFSFLLSAFRFVPPPFLQKQSKTPDIPLHSSRRKKFFGRGARPSRVRWQRFSIWVGRAPRLSRLGASPKRLQKRVALYADEFLRPSEAPGVDRRGARPTQDF